ncbi:sugar transferase [Rhabdothermincola sp.]|uniref:sugar transferase n=1 Tax=Rhabdothermincola sp. TaxID=2820405 RepID=UPI002FE11BDC
MRRAARPLLYAGIVTAVVGLSVYHSRAIADPPYSYTSTSRFGWSLLYIAVLAVVAYGLGLPDLPRSPRQAVTTSVAAAGAGAFVVSIVQLFLGEALLPRFVVFGSAILLVPWYLVCVALAGAGVPAVTGDRVLVVSDTVDPSLLREDVARSPERPAIVIEVLPVDAAASNGRGIEPLVERARRDRIDLLVLDRDAQASPTIVAQAAAMHESGLRIRTLSLFYEEWLGMLPVSELERVSLMFDIGELHRARYGRVKRVVDVLFGIVGLVLLALLTPVVLIGNLVANRGPLLYRQTRVGKNGQHFEILKFRTMRAGPDEAATGWTVEADPRITPFGRVLRVTHLDELPQVVNILRGDLSLVGPRPEQPRYVEELSQKLPFYDLRHLVRPGLTGWAQVKYGYAGDERDALEKLQYEFYYLRRQSLALDLRIVGRTIRSVLGREGR